MVTAEQERQRLLDKYTYIQVKDKFDILRAHFLFEKLGYEFFESEEMLLKLMKGEDFSYISEYFYMVKDGSGWRTQSHLLGTGNKVPEMEKDVDRYLKLVDKGKMSDIEKEECIEKLYLMLNKFWEITMFLYDNYYSEDDLNIVESNLSNLENTLSEMYPTFEGASKFRHSSSFDDIRKRYIEDMKTHKRESMIDEVLN